MIGPTVLMEAAAMAVQATADDAATAVALAGVQFQPGATHVAAISCRIQSDVVTVISAERVQLFSGVVARVNAANSDGRATTAASVLLEGHGLKKGSSDCAVVKQQPGDEGFVCHPGKSAATADLAALCVGQPGLMSSLAAVLLRQDASKNQQGTFASASLSKSAQFASAALGLQCRLEHILWRNTSLQEVTLQRQPSVLYSVKWEVHSSRPATSLVGEISFCQKMCQSHHKEEYSLQESTLLEGLG